MSAELNEFFTILSTLCVGIMAALAPVLVARINRQAKATDAKIDGVAESLRTNHGTTGPGNSLDGLHVKLDSLAYDVHVLGRDVGHLRDAEPENDRRMTAIEVAVTSARAAQDARVQGIADRVHSLERIHLGDTPE